jgi:hypothetical protein
MILHSMFWLISVYYLYIYIYDMQAEELLPAGNTKQQACSTVPN